MRLHIKEVVLPKIETHYRYSDYHCEDGLKVRLSRFYSVKETDCFHYVVDEWDFNNMKRWNFKSLLELNYDKFINVRKVGKNSIRSYCYEDKNKALNSFKERKKSQLFHAETAISKATLALKGIDGMTVEVIGESVNCGLDEHLSTFIFD